MSDETDAPKSDDSFDLDQFERLVQLMDTHDLREVRLTGGGQKWHVRRGGVEAPAPQTAAAPPAVAAVPAAPPAVPTSAEPAASSASSGSGNFITSPTIGTFYTKPDPADPAFVSVGDSVKPDTIVCLIEAMKVFNQIPAEKSGKIAKVLVSDGDPVEFGQPLFELS